MRPVDAIGAQPETGDELAHLGLGGVAARATAKASSARAKRAIARSGGVLLHGDAQLLEPVGGLVETPPRQDVGQAGRRRRHAGRPGDPG